MSRELVAAEPQAPEPAPTGTEPPARRLPRLGRPAWSAWTTALSLLVVLGFAARVVALESVPATLTAPELASLPAAWFGVPDPALPLGIELILLRLIEAIFGPSAWAARLPAAILSAVTIVPLAALARRYLSPGGALLVALIAVAAPWSLLVGRMVEPATAAPLLLVTAVLLLHLGWESCRIGWFVAAGVVAGLGFLGDPAGRAIPWIVLGLGAAGDRWRPAARWTAGRPGLGPLAIGLVLPLLAGLFLVPGGLGDLWTSFREGSIFAAPGDSLIGTLIGRIWITFRAFIIEDSVIWDPARPFAPGTGAFDPISAVLILVGLVIGAIRFRSTAIWWVLLIVPFVVNQAIGGPTPDLGQAAIAIPALAVFAGLAWNRLPLPATDARRLAQAVLALAILIAAGGNLTNYGRWVGAPEFARARQPAFPASDLTAWAEDQERRAAIDQAVEDPFVWARLPRPVRPIATVAAPAGRPNPAAVPPPVAAVLPAQVAFVIGGPAAGPLSFKEPTGAAIAPNGAIWIVDSGNRRVVRVSPTGTFEQAIVGGDPVNLVEPWDIAIDAAGTVYVLDAERNLIVVLGPNGEPRGEVGLSLGMFHPRGLTIDPAGNFVIADTGGNRVIRARPTGELISQLGSRDNQLFDQPTDALVDGAGNLYVVEPQPARLTRFGPDGQLAASWPIAKSDTRIAPRLAPVSGELLAVTSPPAGMLEVFAPTGQALAAVNLRELGPFAADRPMGISVRNDRAVITDLAGHRVGVLTVVWPAR